MPLEYDSPIGLSAIMPVLDDYVVWYGRLMKSYFSGEVFREEAPPVFLEWLADAKSKNSIDEMTAERIRRIHAGMTEAAAAFVLKCGVRENPPLKEYDELNGYYEEFIQIMRRLELDHAAENSGFDDKTGLRSVKLMRSDITRELDRRARRGNPLSLALVKINSFDHDWLDNKDTHSVLIRKVSDRIKECLRSFDDAYYLGDEYFLLSLKHADLLGSQAAINRLNHDIAAARIPCPDTTGKTVSVTTLVCEPSPGDDVDALLANMKRDLEKVEESGAVIQYNDLSPLQRYIHSLDQNK